MSNQLRCGHCGKFLPHNLEKVNYITPAAPMTDLDPPEPYPVCTRCKVNDELNNWWNKWREQENKICY